MTRESRKARFLPDVQTNPQNPDKVPKSPRASSLQRPRKSGISCIPREVQAIPGWLGESRKSRKGVLDGPGCPSKSSIWMDAGKSGKPKKSIIYWTARQIQEIQDLSQGFLKARGGTGNSKNPGFSDFPGKSRKSRIFWESRIFFLEAGEASWIQKIPRKYKISRFLCGSPQETKSVLDDVVDRCQTMPQLMVH